MNKVETRIRKMAVNKTDLICVSWNSNIDSPSYLTPSSYFFTMLK